MRFVMGFGVVVLVGLLVPAVELERARPVVHASAAQLDSNVYFGSVCSYRVTLRSDNGVVSVFEVPRGVLLSIHSDVATVPPEPRGEFPWSFDGDVTLRMRRADEISNQESRGSREIMARAPVAIASRGAHVAVDKLDDCLARF